MAVAGWRGGQHGLYLDRVRQLDPDTIRQFRDGLISDQASGGETNRRGALDTLQGWSDQKNGDPKTLQFLTDELREIREINLTGMIGFCEQLLYDMGAVDQR